MEKLFSYLLKSYDKNNLELFLKAKFLLISIAIAILGLTVTLIYTSYTFGINSTTVLVESIGFSIMILALVVLLKGNYFFAGHMILITGFCTVWIIMFTEPTSSVLIKLDTIVFILVLLALIPLMFFKNKKPLIYYFLINFIIFCVFNYYLIKEANLTTREYVDYALDNTIAMLFLLVISYNLFRIYSHALTSLRDELKERQKAELSLKEFRVFLTSIINSMPSMIIGIDEKNKIILWNQETVQLTGVSQDNALDNKLSDILPQLNFLETYIKNVKINNRISQLNKQPVLWEEKKFYMNIIIYPLLYADVNGVVIRLDDISERLQMEETIVQSEKMALVGEVAGNITHDFNNILSIIMGNTELSLKSCNEPETRKKLDLIYKQTKRGKNLIKNLIAFAKDQEPKREYFNINEKIDLVINLMKKDLAGIELIKEFEEEIDELFADPGMIEHALVNLLQNAIHATSLTENPRITIKSYSVQNKIHFEVADNGCGIAEKHIEKVYSPSFTLKGSKDKTNSYRADIKGTGYGMSNVKNYIQQHCGEIDIQSKIGDGTKFTVILPLIKKGLSDEEKIQINESIKFINKKILLVEDETSIADIQYTVLTEQPCHHDVDIAENAELAIDLFNKNRYDLISLDYSLKGRINGMDVYNHIRLTEKKIPILFISGNIEFLESIRKLKNRDKYLEHQSKPCMNQDYLKSIDNLFEMSEKSK